MTEIKVDEIDVLLKEAIKEIGVESPSTDFTISVMTKIQKLSNPSPVHKYDPLISKPIWALLILIVIALFAFLLVANNLLNITWFSDTSYKWLTDFTMPNYLPLVSFSNTFVYGMVCFALLMGVQVVMLKRHFDKRFTIN